MLKLKVMMIVRFILVFSIYSTNSVLCFAQGVETLVYTQSTYQRIQYVEDAVLWGISDYWATPVETLTKQQGDCEDIAIAKYFSLLNKRVPKEKLRLVYVLKGDSVHMVLEYFEGDLIYVLDSRYEQIYLADRYYKGTRLASFNHDYLWVNEHVFRIAEITLHKWSELLDKMDFRHQARFKELETEVFR
ncbi:transglutaminase-like cysteine peptidase [Vibrio campbellii]|uniref:Transglutaminase-like cysteine peptidase n=2 Tax=Vibrio campbellii TaxID=680 RepID=A0ACC7RI06_9VIBR